MHIIHRLHSILRLIVNPIFLKLEAGGAYVAGQLFFKHLKSIECNSQVLSSIEI